MKTTWTIDISRARAKFQMNSWKRRVAVLSYYYCQYYYYYFFFTLGIKDPEGFNNIIIIIIKIEVGLPIRPTSYKPW